MVQWQEGCGGAGEGGLSVSQICSHGEKPLLFADSGFAGAGSPGEECAWRVHR